MRTTATHIRQGDVVTFDKSHTGTKFNVTHVSRGLTSGFVYLSVVSDHGASHPIVDSDEPVTIHHREESNA